MRFEHERVLGANPIWTFFLISPALAIPGIIVGAILASARALGEFGATITFASNIPGETRTISAAIYTYTQLPGGDEYAMPLTIVAIAISLVALKLVFQRNPRLFLARRENNA